MRFGYFRVSGAGNDFLALVEPSQAPTAEQIRNWCRRGVALGADGLFVLRRADSGAAVTMDYYNADGHPASLCLNGARCAARLAFFLGWAGQRVEVRTDCGSVAAQEVDGTRIRLEAPLPQESPHGRVVETGEESYRGFLVRVGVPHFVVPCAGSLDEVPVASLGARLRRHPDFGPEGTNVDFVRFPSAHEALIRSFERGIEGETLACGTGVLAAVAAGLESRHSQLPVTVWPRSRFPLEVGGETAGSSPRRWHLTGDARVVAQGEILPGADGQAPDR